MKYFGYMPNDLVNGQGICVSLWTSGCPFHCEGCHNPEAWDKEAGYDVPSDIRGRLVKAISANGIERNFSILGGEPLAPWNRQFVSEVITSIRAAHPNIKIFLWTGFTIEELNITEDKYIEHILENIDVLIDGQFILEQRDTTLPLRGSRNQRILYRGKDF